MSAQYCMDRDGLNLRVRLQHTHTHTHTHTLLKITQQTCMKKTELSITG